MRTLSRWVTDARRVALEVRVMVAVDVDARHGSADD